MKIMFITVYFYIIIQNYHCCAVWQIACVEDKPGAITELERLEGIVFNWQIKVQQQQMAILDEEERLIRTQMEAITNQIKGTVIYFYVVVFRIFITFKLASF